MLPFVPSIFVAKPIELDVFLSEENESKHLLFNLIITMSFAVVAIFKEHCIDNFMFFLSEFRAGKTQIESSPS